MTPLAYAIIAALGNIVGGLAVTRRAKQSLRFIEGVLAFGAGFMLAVALVEILPEAYAMQGATTAAFYVLVGYLFATWSGLVRRISVASSICDCRSLTLP